MPRTLLEVLDLVCESGVQLTSPGRSHGAVDGGRNEGMGKLDARSLDPDDSRVLGGREVGLVHERRRRARRCGSHEQGIARPFRKAQDAGTEELSQVAGHRDDSPSF